MQNIIFIYLGTDIMMEYWWESGVIVNRKILLAKDTNLFLKEMLRALSLGLDCDQVSGDQVASQRSVHSPVTGMSYPRTIESLSDAHRAPKLDP